MLNISNTFAKRLLEELESRNLTQKELADKVGVTEATISRYLTSNRTPRMEILLDIAEALEINVDDLLHDITIIKNSSNGEYNGFKDKEIFAKRLVELLYKNNISQSELAKKLDITKSTVSKYTTGVNYPDTEKLILIAKILDTSIDYMLGLTNDEELQSLRNFKNEIIKCIENNK